MANRGLIAPATPSLRALYRASDSGRELPTLNIVSAFRSEFRRDFARLIHSPAFRRLQGKTQLFPSTESEFFRNRLTHSLEVAQIAKGIGARLNNQISEFQTGATAMDLDIIETAALAHDLGHPPFGHIGEIALDQLMSDDGGFEGNAQTLRILARLEKKEAWRDPFTLQGQDKRVGLNLTYRTLAAVLKYDCEIPLRDKNRTKPGKLEKGYYKTEGQLVQRVKRSVRYERAKLKDQFKTVECQIMDLADDIAYSTYDLEDALKAGFITPLEIAAAATDNLLLAKIGKKVAESIKGFTATDVIRVLLKIFTTRGLFEGSLLKEMIGKKRLTNELAVKVTQGIAIGRFAASSKFCSDGYQRTQLTSSLVDEFMSGVRVKWNPSEPALTKIWLDDPVLEQVEVLKHYTFEKLIMSPRIKLVEHRGTDIVRKIFLSLTSQKRKGFQLLPEDYRHWYASAKDDATRKRVVCDFVAGMTDRYAFEFYNRLTSSKPETFFKPH